MFSDTTGRFHLDLDGKGGVRDLKPRFGSRYAGSVPLGGDWNGDGWDTVAVYQAFTRKLLIRASHRTEQTEKIGFVYPWAKKAWLPLSGDWDGDGIDTIGFYDPSKGNFHLSVGAHVTKSVKRFRFGPKASQRLPVSGDWDGDGKDSVGLFDAATGRFHLTDSTSGTARGDKFRAVRNAQGLRPFAGDWDGDGRDNVGLYHPVKRSLKFFDGYSKDSSVRRRKLGGRHQGWYPVAGNWAHTPVRINAGGFAYRDQDGHVWQEDSGYNRGTANLIPETDIADTFDDRLYFSERRGPKQPRKLKYTLPVASGNYTLRLHFAETQQSAFAPAARVFDVKVEDRLVLDDLDVYSESGAFRALIKSVPVEIADSSLTIEFVSEVGSPIASAIELVAGDWVSPPSITPPGGSFTEDFQVTLSTATANSKIHYSTDGSTPSKESARYRGPFVIARDTILKARAYKDGIGSEIASRAFRQQETTNPNGGKLKGSLSGTPRSSNLSDEGSSDWAHWGRSSATSFDRKANGGSQISNVAIIGNEPKRRHMDSVVSYSWNDGLPTSSSAGTTTGIYIARPGNGYRISAPADAGSRSLRVYLGVWMARARIEAAISDSSAPDYVAYIDNPEGATTQVLNLDYSAVRRGQTLILRVVVETAYAPLGNVMLESATLTGDMPPALYSDDFSDGNANGWLFVSDGGRGSNWQATGGALRQTKRIETVSSFDESYHLGTYAVLTAIPSQGDLRFEVDATFLSQGLADDIGIMFRYQNPDNYYRFTMNSRYGFSRLEKRLGGTFSTLAANARGFPQVGTAINMAVLLKGSKIQVFVNGDPLFAADDASLDGGRVALYTQDDSRFDNVLLEPVGSSPSLVLATPTAHSVDTDGTLNAQALVINAPGGSSVEFSLDGGIPSVDSTPPYAATFSNVSRSFDHTVVAVLRNGSGNELDRDTNTVVGARGDRYVAIGDSITNGSNDNYASDNTSASGRVLGFQGYAAVATDLLDASTPFPNLIVNEGVGGAKTSDVLANIDSVIERNPGSNGALILLGTNDSSAVTLAVPSGAGCSGSACNGTFKGNMQSIINSLPTGMTPTIALIPPAFGATVVGSPFADPLTASRNQRVQAYNNVILNELSLLPGVRIGPDLFSALLTPGKNLISLYDDRIHFNGLGHAYHAHLWHNALNAANPVALPYILGNLEPSTSSPYLQQNLLEAGDRYYVDEPFTLSNIPALLNGGIWIMTANADRLKTSSSYLSFNTDRPVTVYVAYDAGATALPNWLRTGNGFNPAGSQIQVSGDPRTSTLRLYAKSYPTGAITDLAANLANGASGANSNYAVIVKP